MSFKNCSILFSRTYTYVNHSNSLGLYIRAGALRENKTHAKISWTKVGTTVVPPFFEHAVFEFPDFSNYFLGPLDLPYEVLIS